MAYNSDGYIMIDFTEVDFRRTNQTIDGLYKRCVDVIGTNKFILVINANGRTPLPATCSFTNNQYVIDTCIYMFAISSNDNLFIRRNDVPASDIIDDNSISVDKTWSSIKINTELESKADTSALADYQPLLTAGTNINIDENNVISSTGGAVIDDSVIVNNKVWSSLNTVEMLAPINTVIGDPATFNTSLALPVVEYRTHYSATQSGSGDPTPYNVRTIIPTSEAILNANGVLINIPLGSANYYRGTIDNNGNIYDDYFVYSINSSNIMQNNNNINVFGVSMASGISSEGYIVAMCNRYTAREYTTAATMLNFTIDGYAGTFNGVQGRYIKWKDERFSTLSDMQNYVSDNPIIVVAKRHTPYIYQTTPYTNINTINGSNVFSSDYGAVKISYKALPIDLL